MVPEKNDIFSQNTNLNRFRWPYYVSWPILTANQKIQKGRWVDGGLIPVGLHGVGP